VGVNTNDIWSAYKISATPKFSAECPGELEAKLERIDISNVAEKKVSAHSAGKPKTPNPQPRRVDPAATPTPELATCNSKNNDQAQRRRS
jgi:hypothetical protein